MTRRQRLTQGALALGIPLLLGWIGGGLMRPEPASLFAPLLGPWAGLVYGHSECTMATVAPVPSAAVVAFGLLAITSLSVTRRRGPQTLALLVAAVWALSWVAMAGFSIVNTLS